MMREFYERQHDGRCAKDGLRCSWKYAPTPSELSQDLLHDRPSLYLGFQFHHRIGGTGRRQTRKDDVVTFEQRGQRMTSKRLLRFAAVKKYMRDVRVFGEQSRKVVDHFLSN